MKRLFFVFIVACNSLEAAVPLDKKDFGADDDASSTLSGASDRSCRSTYSTGSNWVRRPGAIIYGGGSDCDLSCCQRSCLWTLLKAMTCNCCGIAKDDDHAYGQQWQKKDFEALDDDIAAMEQQAKVDAALPVGVIRISTPVTCKNKE